MNSHYIELKFNWNWIGTLRIVIHVLQNRRHAGEYGAHWDKTNKKSWQFKMVIFCLFVFFQWMSSCKGPIIIEFHWYWIPAWNVTIGSANFFKKMDKLSYQGSSCVFNYIVTPWYRSLSIVIHRNLLLLITVSGTDMMEDNPKLSLDR